MARGAIGDSSGTEAKAARSSFRHPFQLLALLLGAWACTPVAGDDLALFSGIARVSCATGPVAYAAALSQDLPDPSFENRWHVLLLPDGPLECLTPRRIERVWIRTSATSRGSYTIDIPGWAVVEITPGAPGLREAFRRAAPGSESRFKQVVTLTREGDGIRLLIEEPR